MEQMIRIIALDLDDTTFNDKKEITPRTQAAIAAAIQYGIIVMPATGRPIVGIPKEFTDIPGVRYAAACNGAVVVNLLEDQIVYESTIPREKVLEVMHRLKDVKGTLELYMNGRAYISREHMEHIDEYVPSAPLRAYMKRTRIVKEDLEEYYRACPYEVEKMNMSYATIEQKDKIKKLLEPVLKDLDCVNGQPTNLELTKAGTDKGEALLQFGQLMGISKEQIMAFGDSSNDREMLRKVGVGVAMANGDPKIQAEADFVTQYTNNENGVAIVIEELLESITSPKKLILDAKSMKNRESAIEQIVNAFHFPENCEKNLESLASILQQISEPIEITFCHCELLEKNLGDYAQKLLDVFADAAEMNANLIFNMEEVVFTDDNLI